MKQCPSCGRKNLDQDKYCPVCHYYMGNVPISPDRSIHKNLATNPIVTCPYCKSTNTTKISGISKAGSVMMFGIFSQKVKKQWHCNNCKSDF